MLCYMLKEFRFPLIILTHYDIIGWLTPSLESYLPIKRFRVSFEDESSLRESIDTPGNSTTYNRDLYV